MHGSALCCKHRFHVSHGTGSAVEHVPGPGRGNMIKLIPGPGWVPPETSTPGSEKHKIGP